MNGAYQFECLLKLIERIRQTHMDLSTQFNRENHTWMLLLNVAYFFISIIYSKE